MAITITRNGVTQAVSHPENTPRKGVDINPAGVTLEVTHAELEEIRQALSSHRRSWEVQANTKKGQAKVHWSKNATIEEGSIILVGGKAKAAFDRRSHNKRQLQAKSATIASLLAKVNTK